MRRKRTVAESSWFRRENIADANMHITVQSVQYLFFLTFMTKVPFFGLYLYFNMITPKKMILGESDK